MPGQNNVITGKSTIFLCSKNKKNILSSTRRLERVQIIANDPKQDSPISVTMKTNVLPQTFSKAAAVNFKNTT